MELNELYQSVRKNLSSQRLNEITRTIIHAHKHGNTSLLSSMHRDISGYNHGEELTPSKIFLGLIKHFHPDRYEYIAKDLENSFQNRDTGRLLFYKNLLTADRSAAREEKQRYKFEPEDFGIHDNSYSFYSSFSMGESVHDAGVSESDFEFDVLSAIKSQLFGNLDFEFSLHDLEQLEGDLELAGYGLQDLDGLEYCINITKLDLSFNQIDSIYEISRLEYLRELYLGGNEIHDLTPLEGLNNLEILDLSQNDIEDISPLFRLPTLRFVDLRNNPVSDAAKLEHLGVIVLIK